jgi:hypothetical protein
MDRLTAGWWRASGACIATNRFNLDHASMTSTIESPRIPLRMLLWALVASCLLMALSTQAAIRRVGEASDGVNGDGSELLLSVFDASAQITYTLDLGVYMDAFFATGQDDNGYQRFWIIDPTTDAAWNSFAAASSNLANATWAVFAADAVGAATPNNRRWFVTAKQGLEGNISNISNAQLSNAQSGQLDPYIIAHNQLPTHQNPADPANPSSAESIAINGSGYYNPQTSTLADADFGAVLRFTFTNNSFPDPTNTIGQSSWFYYLTRSSTSNLSTAKVRVDEFDNLGGDGYWGFTQELGSSRYLLSYTLPAFRSQTEQVRGLTFSNSFARMAGVLSLAGGADRAETVLMLSEGFLRGLALEGSLARDERAQVTTAMMPTLVSSVPEPHAAWLAMAGLATAWWRRRAGRASERSALAR